VSETVSPATHAHQIFGAFDERNIAALEALVTDDVRLRLGNAEAVDGKAAFATALQAFFASVAAFRHVVQDVWSAGSILIAELEVHYTRHDGGEVAIPCCNVFLLRDGLVAEYRVYIDMTPVYA